MKKMIQIRNVPEELHRRLKARAATEGMSLSEYLLDEIRRIAERPTLAELRARVANFSGTPPRINAAADVRAERNAR